MADINLLPVDITKENKSSNLADTLKRITVFASILFFIIVAGGLGLVIFFTKQEQDLSVKENSLRQSISALESSEQQLFLIKDRIDKIMPILPLKRYQMEAWLIL